MGEGEKPARACALVHKGVEYFLKPHTIQLDLLPRWFDCCNYAIERLRVLRRCVVSRSSKVGGLPQTLFVLG